MTKVKIERAEKGRGDSDFITTHSGKRFYPLAPRAEEVDVDDIAWALAHQCRWTGHTRRFYSVGQHSIRTMLTLKREGHGPAIQLRGLGHDGSEAYISDINRPAKHGKDLKGYVKVEKPIQDAVFQAFGLSSQHEFHNHLVKEADDALLLAEAEELMPEEALRHARAHVNSSYEVPFELPQSPKWTYLRFLYHYHRLQGEIQGEKGLLNNAKSLFRVLFR